MPNNTVRQKLDTFQKKIEDLSYEIRKSVVGQDEMIESIFIAMLTNGHVLIEGAPGLAKTLTVKTLATALGLPFKRIQFTPDLLPSDIVGTEIYTQGKTEFEVKFGPIFASVILADEINRAPAKVQSALLEAMQEKQVTIGKKTYKLNKPFVVLATQNPIEQEGTYKLPEAQVDRFIMKIDIDYPTDEQEFEIVQRVVGSPGLDTNSVMNEQDILEMIEFVDKVYLDNAVIQYIVDINTLTRNLGKNKRLKEFEKYIEYGCSPRGAIALAKVSKARAILSGRSYVNPDDVYDSAHSTLRHRIILNYEAIADGITSDEIITKILTEIPRPEITGEDPSKITPEEKAEKEQNESSLFKTVGAENNSQNPVNNSPS